MHRTNAPHGSNLRKGRSSLRNQIYLVTSRCNSRQPLFLIPELAQVVVDEIRRSDATGITKTYAFVVMPDHLHWLFALSGKSLGDAVGIVKGRASRHINIIRKRTSPVWQPGFHDRALRRMESLEEAGYYILNNPVRAGLVAHYSQYEMLYAAWL